MLRKTYQGIVRSQGLENELQQHDSCAVHVEAVWVVQAPQNRGESCSHRHRRGSRGLGGHDVLLGRCVSWVQKKLIGHIVDPHSEISSCSHVDELGSGVCL